MVHLYRHDELAPDQAVILSTLEKKCAFKQIAVPTMKTFTNRPERDELEARLAASRHEATGRQQTLLAAEQNGQAEAIFEPDR